MKLFGTSFAERTAAAHRALRQQQKPAVVNRYEAGQQWSSKRSYLPGFTQDPRFDADSASRGEIVRKSRYWERNSGVMNAIGDLFEQYVIGPNGLVLTPATSSEEWNGRAKPAFDEWAESCDVSTQFDLADRMIVGARTELFDGGYYIIKTWRNGRPAIQLLEGHRIATPPSKWGDEGKTIVEGHELDPKSGAVVAYWVSDSFVEDGYRRLPATSVIHVFSPSRIGQVRELPYGYSVLNELHDLEDLRLLEMQASKDAARISNVLKNEAGEVVDYEKLMREASEVEDTTNAGDAVTEERVKHISKVTGAGTIALKTGEDIAQLKSERPSVTQQWLWNYYLSLVCAGHGVSRMLIFPESIQGTVARGVFDMAATFFRARSRLHGMAAISIYRYWASWARYYDPRCINAPADWQRVTVRPPRAINVDVGRNAAAEVAGLEAGTTTIEDIYAPQGKDWREQIRQRGREEQFIDGIAKEFGVAPERIRKAIGEAVKADLAAERENRSTEDNLIPTT